MSILEKATENGAVNCAPVQSGRSVIIVACPHDERDPWMDRDLTRLRHCQEKAYQPGIAPAIGRAGFGRECPMRIVKDGLGRRCGHRVLQSTQQVLRDPAFSRRVRLRNRLPIPRQDEMVMRQTHTAKPLFQHARDVERARLPGV